MPQYWQIAAGSYGRNYSQYFLKYGIAFVGGEFKERIEQVNEGDIVVLKVGKTMKAVGTVVQRSGKHSGCCDKEWLKDFDGWELPAYCYVDWRKPKKEIKTNRSMGRRTIERIGVETIRNQTRIILGSGRAEKVSLEPSKTQEVEVHEIQECLKKAGLRASEGELTKKLSTICRIRSLAKDYSNSEYGWDWVLEHETRTFLVAPLLLALGWSERQIKIELACDGGKVDIALFRKNFEGNMDDCVAIIETKAFHFGLDDAKEQAQSYSKYFPKCKTVVILNGYCYKIHPTDKNNNFKTARPAYLNLLKPTKKYPIDPENVDGALEAIKWLLPNSYSG